MNEDARLRQRLKGNGCRTLATQDARRHRRRRRVLLRSSRAPPRPQRRLYVGGEEAEDRARAPVAPACTMLAKAAAGQVSAHLTDRIDVLAQGAASVASATSALVLTATATSSKPRGAAAFCSFFLL